ncbi:MAG: NAD(P)H-dependent glycerol-3-phosphate dehydrogenase [Candidatus Bipolaricaulota bacterium]|nr:NAD(P)H-dependent glycerol-3-phosphate dehydrogenase [Candidatus Bipolaricaulota bacterium]MCS7275006.1 NAD(P)H-dependent glycerol-3-phosphate dehydrogenase [Candidatus Bipolaricaulota bacterium]MDW8110529.1 NAD(P)H-dependent glycerol-3-phosphate dehydrogenase [Candidatus Bipolaricaulota bacterium]MDW8329320.1 NAD(P)H-dependent glycerol-3-phosphate dehydrogenase [Candidatus Bipolaricaulota bacterium]
MRISVIGAGGWGTALARLLARKGHSVCLWARRPQFAQDLDRKRVNEKYLPGVPLPKDNLHVTSDLTEALQETEIVLLAVPSFAVRETARKLKPFLGKHVLAVINTAKGLERETLYTMSMVLKEELNELAQQKIFTLSGPSHAEEVGRDAPTSVVIAGEDAQTGIALQRAFMTERFRLYFSDDILGVEYGGTVKNIIALAAGISDGLGYGDNTKAALIARGLAEMVRLGVKLGARRETFFGLSGLGDLVATCTSRHSRNRAVGYRIGQGEKLPQILQSMSMVAEGVYATQAVRALARAQGVELPITEAVYAILYENSDPLEQLNALMTRDPKREGL